MHSNYMIQIYFVHVCTTVQMYQDTQHSTSQKRFMSGVKRV